MCVFARRGFFKDLTEPERASLSLWKAIKDVVGGQKVFLFFILLFFFYFNVVMNESTVAILCLPPQNSCLNISVVAWRDVSGLDTWVMYVALFFFFFFF